MILAAAGCARIDPPMPPPPTMEPAFLPLMPDEPAVRDTLEARRPLEPRLYTLPLPAVQRSHPAVGRLRGKGSLSIGTTKDGFIVGCRALPTVGDHHRILDVQAARGTACGTDELVAALLKAGRYAARKGEGGVLTVGNIGSVGGGDIPWSISHNSGRDVDIGLYLLGPDGKQVIPDDFVAVDRKGKGEWRGLPVRFDRARTWMMVKSLLTNRRIEIQWLFVADHVRDGLLAHAEKRKEPAGLLKKAAQAMAQPGWKNPHDDHIHLRVYCSRDDLLEGCQDWGSDRPWYVDRTARIEKRALELKRLLRSRDPTKRAGAVTVLGRMDRREALPRVVRLLKDRNPGVRVAAAEALRYLGLWGVSDTVVRAVGRLTDPEALEHLLQALNRRTYRDKRARILARLLKSKREYVLDRGVFQLHRKVRRWALEELVHTRGREAVEVLVKALGWRAVDVDGIREALVALTAMPPSDAPRPWDDWWRTHRRNDPVEWIEDGFRAAGVLSSEEAASKQDIPALVKVVHGDETRAHAALRMIVRITRRTLPRFPVGTIEPVPLLVERAVAQWEPSAY